MSEAELLAAALARPRKERADMALHLLRSLDGPTEGMSQVEWDRAVLDEYRSRRAAHLAHHVEMIPGAEALELIRARLHRGG